MCVIIARKPGIEIPALKMESACHVNGDGYGIAVVDRGKIEIIKEFDPKGNDPERVMKRLEDAKNHQVYLHLRFRTAGAKNEEACHPFDVLSSETDGFHMSFMHNGTLREFEVDKDPLPDSYHFAMKIVRPLLERVRKFCTTDDQMLQDEFIETILTKYAGAASKFVLFDQNGNELIINKDDGYSENGWWASNSYSFNRAHRETDYGYGRYGGGYHGGRNWADDNYEYENGTWTYKGNNSGGRSTASTTGASTSTNSTVGNGSGSGSANANAANTAADATKAALAKDGQAVGSGIKNANVASKHVQPTILSPMRRDTFCELTGLSSLAETACLEREDIEQIIENYPEVATVLIMDLIYELYLINTNSKKVA